MFQIKICGITNEEDARAVVDAGADALGLNFYPKSKRFITGETAARIIDVLPPNILKVGLFVNETVEGVTTTFDRLGLDLIQLHGDEPPAYLLQLGNRPVMKAFRLTAEGLPPIKRYLDELARLSELSREGESETPVESVGREMIPSHPSARQESCPPRIIIQPRRIGNLSYVLIDSHVEGVYGGSGVPADWIACAEFAKNPVVPPLVLAGGLTPLNIGDAIQQVQPTAVDTASGVERSAGRKDCHLVAAFVKNARAAFLSKAR